MILDVKSRHIRSSPYVPFFHSLCDDCFAEFSSGLLFKSHFHLSYDDLYRKKDVFRRRGQLYFVITSSLFICVISVAAELRKSLAEKKHFFEN